DQLEQFTVQTGLRTGRYLTWHISGNSTRTTPLYESAASVSGVNLLQFQNTHIDVNLRFAFGEKIIQSFGQNMVIESPYPVLFMSYSRGLKDLFDGEIEFNKIELRLEH